MVKRKSPVLHKVKAHLRNGKHIKSFNRGSGIKPMSGITRRVVGGRVITGALGVGAVPGMEAIVIPIYTHLPPSKTKKVSFEKPTTGFYTHTPSGLKPHDIIKRSDMLLRKYNQGLHTWRKVGIVAELKGLSEEYMRLTGQPTMENIQFRDLFTKEQLEEYLQQLKKRRKKRRKK